jgi:type I restriction enzyme R subunit
MSKETKEIHFEDHIERHLLEVQRFRKVAPPAYDKALCLIPEEVMAFLEATQSDALQALYTQYGTETAQRVLENLSKNIEQHGTLEVLRKGIKDRGQHLRFAYFQPASGLNPEHETLYRENRFALVRQLKYSTRNENSIDVVLFLNGLPIATAELKNSLTGQFVEHAKKQYRTDRDPAEPLLKFMRCLVHFAVGNEKVYMTTKLAKDSTFFLPFNLDIENPVNPEGFATHYLWEEVWAPDSLLEIIQHFLVLQEDNEREYDARSGSVVTRSKKTFIFPRYHQLAVVRALLAQVRVDGPGRNYLVQHSAGSGKSNSIAWLAHRLSSLYATREAQERIFDSVIVVTDRRVLDRQLQHTIRQFEQTGGVVEAIDEKKSSQDLKTALEKGKAIIITTLQKFPVISESISQLKGKRFAVIIDEAHSSQSGESAKHLKKALSVELEMAEEEDREDFDLEEEVIREIKVRGRMPHISYFAFTATPKNKTLELFGTKGADGKYRAFHLYSMRQAIEEGFIKDVLRNFTSFRRYYKLAKKLSVADKEYDKKKAILVLGSHVDLKPHAIDTKSRIMLEHFAEKTAKAIQGKARAMVVTRSRLHAVRYKQAFDRIMQEMAMPYRALVAFSGTVKDPDTLLEHTEVSMNGLPPGTGIPEALKMPQYRILIVAEKYQTGFDEPMLHTMFVDKKLGGVNTVQTLSRLNRTTKGKEDPVVIDFVNETEDVQKDFQDYYQTTLLEEETDPNKLYDLQRDLLAFDVFDRGDVEALVTVYFDPARPAEHLQPLLDAVVKRWQDKSFDEQEDFRSEVLGYVRLYRFVSQLVTFTDTDLEKLYVFLAHLMKKLPRRKSVLPRQVLDEVDLDSYRVQYKFTTSISLAAEDAPLPPVGARKGGVSADEQFDLLSNIVQYLNDSFGADLTEEDKVDLGAMKEKVMQSEEMRTFQNPNNSRSRVKDKFGELIEAVLLEFVNTKLDLYNKLSDQKVKNALTERWFGEFEAGKGGGAGAAK